MPIICDLRSPGRSDAKSAMSSPSLYVAAIIVRCIIVAMKPHGGSKQALIRLFRPVSSGWKVTHCRLPQQAVMPVRVVVAEKGTSRRASGG